MKKFTIPCNFGGTKSPFTVYIGEPEQRHHPLHFQSDWLSKERGGSIPGDVMDAIAKLKELADKNGVSFEDLCVYALQVASEEDANLNATKPQENFDALNATTENSEENSGG
ncbi:MAG: DUF2610 domain-containing protein [Alphaproteobacteria bacterium]|nr:DUF2610 domain-containing protein [Alphaproteobacteria bacterium]